MTNEGNDVREEKEAFTFRVSQSQQKTDFLNRPPCLGPLAQTRILCCGHLTSIYYVNREQYSRTPFHELLIVSDH